MEESVKSHYFKVWKVLLRMTVCYCMVSSKCCKKNEFYYKNKVCHVIIFHCYTPAYEVCGGYTGISLSLGRAGGLSVRKILSRQLLPSYLLDTWQKCSLGAVDVQDTYFVKIPSRITELLPLI